MRLVIAQMMHETNTFSPVPTPWEAFGGPRGPALGREVIEALAGTRTATGAFIDLARAAGAEVVTPVAGNASPSGPVDRAAFERFCGLILAALEPRPEGLLLDLHGAMVVAGGLLDAEGELLRRVRAAHPALPIAVALDLHANVTAQMVTNCDVIAGYKTYPHVDMYEAGERAGSILLRALRGEVRPVMAFGNRPVLAQTLCMATAQGAMQAFVQAAQAAEAAGLLAASAFGGFPLADIPDAGLSAVTVANADEASARKACEAMLDVAWARRAEFIYEPEPLARSLERVRACDGGPVLLLDHADNCASGGTQDTMTVLREALAIGLKGIDVGPIRDPEAVAQLIAAGVGATLTLPLGGKMDMPSIGLRGEPLVLTGVVRAITDGEYTITGPQLTGVRAHMGRTAVLDTGVARIVVTERNQEPWDLGVFTSVGIDPTRSRYLLLKSRMYYRPVFLPFARAAVECDGSGVTSSDWRLFDYQHLRRPMYPLDAQAFEPAPDPHR